MPSNIPRDFNLKGGFPDGASGKESTCNAGYARETLIPRSGRSPGGGNGNPLQYFYLENFMDRGGYSPWGRKESDMTEHSRL